MVLPQLRESLLSCWPEAQLGRCRPRDLGLVVQGTGVGKLCCYLFPNDASEPCWVAKIPRSPLDNAILVREYSLVQALRRRGSAFVRATVPGPLWMTALAGHVVAIEPYLLGRRMDDALVQAEDSANASVRWCLDMALDWLLRSQLALGPSHERLREADVDRYFLRPIRQLKATARLTPLEAAYLERLEDRVRELTGHPLPLVFNHGDFQPANIFVNGGAVQVIDWEFGEMTALPLMDVFGLLARTYAAFNSLEEIDGYLEDYIDAFDAVFMDRGRFTGLTTRCLARACEALSLDPVWLPLLFALFLVNEANKYYAFLRRRGERGYVYLLRSRDGQTSRPYAEQLARQKYVWLLGYVVRHEDRLMFELRPMCSRRAPLSAGAPLAG